MAKPRTHSPTRVWHSATQQWLTQAPAWRRWWARIIDALLVVITVVVVAVATPDALREQAPLLLFVSYPVAVMVFGGLYGGGIGIGQLITRVKSRRTYGGGVPGVWRGMCRYLGIAFLPLVVWAALDGNFPSAWDDHIIVTRRRIPNPQAVGLQQAVPPSGRKRAPAAKARKPGRG